MIETIPEPVLSRRVERLAVQIYRDRAALGVAAGAAVAATLRDRLGGQAMVRMIFAAAPSQHELLATLREAPGIDWSRVIALQMDEYLDLPAGAPQRFGLFLRRHLFDHVRPGAVHPLAASAIAGDDEAAVRAECARYTALLADPIDIVCLGIGENGHLAFNDPPVADFADPALVKPVDLDLACRQQQVNDGCFPALAAVPRRAITLTIPALLSGQRLFCAVPGPTKRMAVRAALEGPVATSCPGSILRTHPSCILYVDTDSYGAEDRD
ncbi:MAG: Glucosamine-6-phosphate deaminase [uncultured Thermomicrobiales bacterium]|uniref:Glucosamine-6-phosphate deaminase n=1 Tax=uncultured Thermomicrobiales bacterium TaxID=1645740 RepID=A0A6J4U7C0_9BACT|nr:MAG: Glucosamine-6-phosphate deaminase [uncultured Thermomicrobiales bacterium]